VRLARRLLDDREDLRVDERAHGVAHEPLLVAQERLDAEVVDARELLHP
jgi:hypothetical protein